MNNLSKSFVGVDVAKQHLDICIFPENKTFKITNNKNGFSKLLKNLSNFNIEQIVCESSGGYEQKFIDLMVSAKEESSTESLYNSVRDSIPRRDLREDYNNTYRIVEYHHMEKEQVKVRTAIGVNGIPVVIPESADDAWLQANQIIPENIIETKAYNDVYYVTTFAPDLDLNEPLAEGYLAKEQLY